MPLIRNRMTMTPRPTKIQISNTCGIPSILPPLSSAQRNLSKHKEHEITRRLSSCIFASFLGLSDRIQVVHDSLRLTMAEEHFSIGKRDTNARVAPNVGATLSNTAHAVSAHRIPGRDGVCLDRLHRNRAQTEAEGADLHAMGGESIVKTAPGERRRSQQKQCGQRHGEA